MQRNKKLKDGEVRFEENELTDANGKTIRPFVAMHDQPVPDEYYAIGDAEPIMSLQDEMDHLRNLRQDFNNSGSLPCDSAQGRMLTS